MDNLASCSLLFLFGVVFGSFAGAQIWRLRARQLQRDKTDGYDYDKKQLKALQPLLGQRSRDDRSICLHCRHKLNWHDLIPLASWLSTGGKCRYCRQPIGFLEPLIEFTMGAVFVLSFLLWPLPLGDTYDWVLFGIWIVSIIPLMMLFFYDLKWQILPLRLNLIYIGIMVIFSGLRYANGDISFWSLLGAVAILAGLYAVLYLMSKQWVGDADRILGIGLGLALADWKLAFLALFLANLIGTIIVLPGMVAGRVSGKATIPLGPLLIIGMLVAFFAGQPLIEWFFSLRFI